MNQIGYSNTVVREPMVHNKMHAQKDIMKYFPIKNKLCFEADSDIFIYQRIFYGDFKMFRQLKISLESLIHFIYLTNLINF